MPVSYRIDPDRRMIHTTLHGVVTMQDVLDYRGRVQVDPSYSPEFVRLIDARDASHSFDRADVRRFADLARLDGPSGSARRAVVMQAGTADPLMDVFQAYTHGHLAEYRVFTSLAEAEAWLRP